MAKRRKEKDEDEDKPFKLPKFDEEGFLKRERKNIKATFVAFLFGGLMGLVCFGFWALMSDSPNIRWPLVLLVAIANAAFIRYILLRINLDISHFTKKNWFTTFGIYFFTWLVVFIVFTNPPFYDDEGPLMEVVSLPDIQELGGNVKIIAKITDNVGLDTDSIMLSLTDPDDNVTTLTPTSFDGGNIISIFEIENPDNLTGEYSYVLSAKDINGKISQASGEFSYSERVIDISNDEDFDKPLDENDEILIDVDSGVSPKNFRVYYKLDDGEEISEEINVDREKVEYPEEYETFPKFKGWVANTNYTMSVYVEVIHYFQNIPIKYSNIVKDSMEYNVSTKDDNDIGDDDPPMPFNWTLGAVQSDVLLNYDAVNLNRPLNVQVILPYPVAVQTPGFELIIFLVALFAVVLIFKYKKKNNNKK